MRFAALTVTVAVIQSAVVVVGLAAPVGKPLAINESGTYQDKGVWLYRTAAGRYGFGPAVVGTNETLVMPAPSPEPGGAVAGVEIIRHPFDTLGYPMRMALVEKLFAASYQITLNASNNGDLWKYDYANPIQDEQPISGKSRVAFKAWGPFHAQAVPLADAPEPEIQTAFDFAKGALQSIGNLPDSQKSLANYGVLFIDDGSTVWVEFGPRFGANEAPHLGCQTQLGRDMVFGYNKKQPNQGTSGKFLQCF
ncbi:MAG TPA: hypothetical protein VIW73_07385 [Candidatus Cybelea sp.]